MAAQFQTILTTMFWVSVRNTWVTRSGCGLCIGNIRASVTADMLACHGDASCPRELCTKVQVAMVIFLILCCLVAVTVPAGVTATTSSRS